MAKLKLLNTIFSKLGSLSKNDGQIVVTRDSKSLYIDLEGERIEVTDWIDIDNEESLLAILTPLINKYYYTKDTNKIWRYIGGEWKCLNDSADDLAPTYTESSTLLKLSSGEKLSVAFGKISKAITDLISHIGDSVKHITSTERINWNSAKTHADSAHARTDATKVEKSSTNGNIKINGTETTVYTHPGGTNPHGTTKSDVGLGNVGNFKAVSTVASQGLSDTEKSNARANIGAGTSSFSGSYNDLTNKPTIPTVGNGTVTIKQAGVSKGTFTMNQNGNTIIELTDNNTTYGVATSSALGLVKSGTDITVDSSGNVSVNDDSHNHVIGNVDGLQNALDGKAASSHTHNYLPLSGGTITGGLLNIRFSGSGNWNEGIRIHEYNNWTTIALCGSDNTEDTGTSANTWSIHNNNGNFYITRNGSNSSRSAILSCINNSWSINNNAIIHSGNIGSQNVNYATSAGNADTVDGHHFNWSGQSGQPTWVWGGNDSSNMYVYNPSNFNVNSSGIVRGSYTGNGGQQNPNYFGVNRVGFLMMNTTVNGDSHYKDWIIMDCYSGSDVGGATAIGVDRQEMRAFIMGSDAVRTSWTRSAELITTTNISSQSVSYATLADEAGSVAWGNVTGKPSTFTPASHTHDYLPLTGGQMTGSIITPKDDSMGIIPNTNNYGQIGSSDKKFYRMYATTFYGSLSGNADSATRLNTSAGSATQPVYFSGGKPVACTYTLGKSVPSNAVFTDTNTWRPVQNNLTSTSTSDCLSAYQGKILNDKIANLASQTATPVITIWAGNRSAMVTDTNSGGGRSLIWNLDESRVGGIDFGVAQDTIRLWIGGTVYNNISMNGSTANTAGTFGAASFYQMSSKRIKRNIEDLSLDKAKKILDLNPVEFDYIESINQGKHGIGLIAEDTLKVIPEVVVIPDNYDETKEIDESDGMPMASKVPSINYTGLIPYMLKVIQEQQKEIDDIKAKLSGTL